MLKPRLPRKTANPPQPTTVSTNMPQISNLSRRLLVTSPLFLRPHPKLSSPFSLFFNPKTPFSNQRLYITVTKVKPPLPFSVCSSYPKQKGSRNSDTNPFGVKRRNSSSLREEDIINNNNSNRINKRDKSDLAMEVEEVSANISSTHGFNQKRAEGRDKSDRPKNLKLKARKLNPVSTISYVQILGTGMDTHDTSPSVLLFFDKQRFIFNAGEGLQRFCTEHKIKLSKIDHIFLSRVCSETAGGLPGLLLTLAGIGEEGMSVNVWGPSDLQYLVNAMKSFIPNAAMVHTHCFGPASESSRVAAPTFNISGNPLVLLDDEVVKLSAILLRPFSSVVADLGKEKSDNMTSGSEDIQQNLDLKVDRNLAVVYICELAEIKGKFDPAKAVALGLRPGPKYRELQLGISVKSDCQNIMVQPSDVLGPSVPGPIVLLVDCPTLCHLKELISLQSLNSYYTDTSGKSPHGSKTVNCVIHLSPSRVVNTSDYQKWMSRFTAAQHIMAGHEMKNVEVPILKSSARIAARLNYICPQFFPATGFQPSQHLHELPSESSASSEDASSNRCESIPAENLLKFHLRPYAQLGLDGCAIPEITSHTQIINELISEIPESTDASQQVRHFWPGDTNPSPGKAFNNKIVTEEPWLQEGALPSCLEDVTRDDLEIVLLGTGSSQPSKYRNVSAIFINLFSKGSILFDCGEGTLGQLKRRFGIDGADDAIRSLRCIWISHIHADHHTGLARILALRRELMKGVSHEPLIVIGPRQLKRFLDAYQRLEDLDMQFLDCKYTTEVFLEYSESSEDASAPRTLIKDTEVADVEQNIGTTLFAKGNRMQSYWKRPVSPVDNAIVFPIMKTLKKLLSDAGLETLISVPVIHCPQAFGVVLKAAERINGAGKTIPGWKIVYSGDTRPCPELVKASHGATVLIHEATFEDGMMEEAVSRNHSTTGEAIEVGDSAGAYRIILTHFSQRYPKIPVFDETHMDKTCIAFDMMSVNLADLPALPRVLPYLKLLFRDEMIVEESDDMNAIIEVAN